MIDATYPKANRKVTSMGVKKGIAAMTPTGSQKLCATKGYARVSPSNAAQESCEVRQAPVQTAQPHRDHVRQAEGLAASGHPIR